MRSMAEKEAEKEAAQESELMNKVEKVHVEYLPIYILGNLCLGTSNIPVGIGFTELMKNVPLAGWSVAWFREQYTICQILCTITILAQFYSLFFIFRSRRNRNFNQRDYLTNAVIKPRAAGAILLMFKTWGAVNVSFPKVYIA